jgi:hypothetical protein
MLLTPVSAAPAGAAVSGRGCFLGRPRGRPVPVLTVGGLSAEPPAAAAAATSSAAPALRLLPSDTPPYVTLRLVTVRPAGAAGGRLLLRPLPPAAWLLLPLPGNIPPMPGPVGAPLCVCCEACHICSCDGLPSADGGGPAGQPMPAAAAAAAAPPPLLVLLSIPAVCWLAPSLVLVCCIGTHWSRGIAGAECTLGSSCWCCWCCWY